MELRQLRYFKAIADAQSFARGAYFLSVAQPALSRSIARLEDQLGQTLFIRHSSGVSLTDEGALFYQHAAQILDQIAGLENIMATEDKKLRGTVKLGAPQSMQAKLCIPVVAKFLKEFSGCALEVIVNSSSQLRNQIINGTLDLAIISNQGSDGAMQLTPMLRENICLICKAEDAEQFGEQVEIKDLFGAPLLVCGYPTGLRYFFEKEFGRYHQEPMIRTEVNSSSLLIDLVRRGAGIGLAPQCVSAQAPDGELKFIPIKGSLVTWALAVGLHRQGSKVVQTLASMLIEHARASVAAEDWPTAELMDAGAKAT